MKTINEMSAMAMRAIALKATEDFNNAEREKAIKYTENYIFPHIRTSAFNRRFEVYFHVDSDVNFKFVVETLVGYGYEVEAKERAIRIGW